VNNLAFNYRPLWKLLIERGMKKTDLVEKIGISSSTLAKMGKNEVVSMEILERLCNYFNCQLSDLVEHVSESEK
jgi:putative transcriptional regulator